MGYELCYLSDIANIQGGYAFKSYDFGNIGEPVIKIANIHPPIISIDNVDRVKNENLIGLDRFKIFQNDILIAMTGATIGKVGRYKEKDVAYLNQRVARISAKKGKLFDDFVYALVTQRGFNLLIEGFASGSAQANISTDAIGKVKIPLFSEMQQLKVGQIIRNLDDQVNLLKQTNKTLEAIAQAIFKSWFVDFDPVHAKQQGKECAGIDKATADLFPNSFVESELGLIPKGWEVKSLGDEVVPKRGKTITKSTTTTGEVPVVAGGLDPAYFHNQSNVLSPAITISSSGANAGFVRLYQQDIWASDCCYISSEQNQEVFYWYIFLKANQEKIYFMQQGAAQPHIYAADLMRLTICSPKDSKLVTAFNTLVTPLFNRIKISNNQIEALSNLRDTLLPRLISGKVDLSNIEEELEGIA